MDKYQNNSNQTHQNAANQSANLAVIAGLISTLGDGLATIAAALAIQEAEQSQNNNGDDLKKMQKQIDTLAKEVKQIKRMLNERK